MNILGGFNVAPGRRVICIRLNSLLPALLPVRRIAQLTPVDGLSPLGYHCLQYAFHYPACFIKL